MHIAICDDEAYIRTYIRTLIEKQSVDYRITEFSSGKELLQFQEENAELGIDILFLDIMLKDIDGMTVAKQLRKKMESQQKAVWGSLPLLIFVTGSQAYMQSAFEVNAFQYIVKPIQESEFERIFAQAVREYQCLLQSNSLQPKEIMVKSKNRMRKVPAEQVYYIESSNRKVILCLKDEKIEYYDKIGELEQELQPDFFRIHKGYLVHMKYVEGYDRTEVRMKNGDNLLISKYKYHDFVKAYMQYITEER